MSLPFPEPTEPIGSRAEVFLGYLDYFRSVLLDKLHGLSEEALATNRLPSGWTPGELVKHLTYVELRWLEWGFEGRDVGEPWGDERDGRWYVGPDESAADLVDALKAQAARSRAVIESHHLHDVGRPGERWDGAEPATLERVLFHLLQEYARHVGHLDIVRELIDGATGE
ncbi:MAG: DinB family protein [Nocardioidaceae bacterium]|nr:DinB family protein [Nocardioidaceae bacterium]